MKVRFTIKRPDSVRRSFSIVRDTVFSDGRREQVRIQDAAIDALNNNLNTGIITLEEANTIIRETIKPRLIRQAGVQTRKDTEDTLTEVNGKIFRQFWEKISSDKDLKNPTSTKNDLLAAIAAVNPLSLVTATKEDLKDALDGLTDKKYRRYAIRLNQLLTHLGREFTINLKKLDSDPVHFVTWTELEQILPNIHSEEVRDLAIVLFCTGVRLGEAFQLTTRKLKSNGSVFIDKQLTHDFKIRAVKNRKAHDTILLPQGREAYERWCCVKDREKFRNRASHQILVAARKTFPDKERHVSPHDLRHSYAIYWLERRATVTEVATLLGDTEATVRRHYTGWIINDRLIDNLTKLLNC